MNQTDCNATQVLDNLFKKKSLEFYVVLIFEVLMGLIGNSLFLLTVARIKTGLSNMYIIMSSLSMTDIVAGLAFSEIVIRDFVITNYGVQYETCKWGLFFSVSAISSNAWHVILMSADRYVAVAHPHR